MSAGVTTVIAAALAVLGTLFSPVLAQRVTARAKLQEFEFAERQRQEERVVDQKRLAYLERRTAYTHLNAQMRAMHRSLLNHIHLIRTESQTEADIIKLDKRGIGTLNTISMSRCLSRMRFSRLQDTLIMA